MSGMWIAIGSAVLSVAGQQQAKKAGKKDAAFLADQQRERAGEVRASSQRQAAEERRKARLVSSAVQARAGGGGTDPGIVWLEGDIAAEGEYRALTALYEGESEARGLNKAADAGIRSSRARARAYNYESASTVMGTASSMYGKYGGKKTDYGLGDRDKWGRE